MTNGARKSPLKLLSVLAATLMLALLVFLLLLHFSSETQPAKVPIQPKPQAASAVAPEKSPEEKHKKCRESILANARQAMAERHSVVAVAILDNGKALCVGLSDDNEFNSLHARASKEAAKVAKKREAEQKRTNIIALAEGRRRIAVALRQRWLDQGVNIKVRVSGKQADRIVLTYPLFDEVWGNRFNKPDELFWMLKAAGFKRVDLDSGFNYHQYWQLAP
jgi:hypothetical protein